MSKRNIILEITQRLERAPNKPATQRVRDILGLIGTYKQLGIDVLKEDADAQSHELYNYVPVVIYANVEDYFRTTIADLIDNQSECQPRAKGLANIRFDIEDILAISGKSVSAGQFIAHSIRLNNLDDISSAMGTLLGNDFWHVLQRACAYNQREGTSFDLTQGDFHYETMKAAIDARHIICHERATSWTTTGTQCFDWIIEAIVLIGNTETILTSLLVGGEMEKEILG